MRELTIALALFVLLSGGTVVVRQASVMQLIWAGLALVAGGLVFSLPCAVRYHALLYRALSPRGALDRRWLLNPTKHHVRLTPEEKARVLPWFYAGAAGWGLTMVGCLVLGGLAFLGG